MLSLFFIFKKTQFGKHEITELGKINIFIKLFYKVIFINFKKFYLYKK